MSIGGRQVQALASGGERGSCGAARYYQVSL
jgi:hypothetical protein